MLAVQERTIQPAFWAGKVGQRGVVDCQLVIGVWFSEH
jgi:hypothetical protein